MHGGAADEVGVLLVTRWLAVVIVGRRRHVGCGDGDGKLAQEVAKGRLRGYGAIVSLHGKGRVKAYHVG